MRGCRGETVKEKALVDAFIKAWNNIVFGRGDYIPKWKKAKAEGNPLEKLRATQMMELTEQPLIQELIPDMARLVMERVEVGDGGEFEFHFMSGIKETVIAE